MGYIPEEVKECYLPRGCTHSHLQLGDSVRLEDITLAFSHVKNRDCVQTKNVFLLIAWGGYLDPSKTRQDFHRGGVN